MTKVGTSKEGDNFRIAVHHNYLKKKREGFPPPLSLLNIMYRYLAIPTIDFPSGLRWNCPSTDFCPQTPGSATATSSPRSRALLHVSCSDQGVDPLSRPFNYFRSLNSFLSISGKRKHYYV